MRILKKLLKWKSGKATAGSSPKGNAVQEAIPAEEEVRTGSFRSPIWFCGPMGEQIVQDLKTMGLWEQMCFGEGKDLPMHAWFPPRSGYNPDKGCYYVEEEPNQIHDQGTDGQRFRWELLLTAVTASGFEKYPKSQLWASMRARYSHMVQCLSKVYALDYPPLKEKIMSWLKDLIQDSHGQWCFCKESLSYCWSHWEPVTQKEFDRIVKEAELSDTYFHQDDSTDLSYQIGLKGCTVTMRRIDPGMGCENRETYIHATREAALGHALELMRQHQQSFSTSPERREKASIQKVAEITVTPVKKHHYWRCEVVLEHWCGRWHLRITDVFATDKYNDGKDSCKVLLPEDFPHMTDQTLADFINGIGPNCPGYEGCRAVKPEEVRPLLEAANAITPEKR